MRSQWALDSEWFWAGTPDWEFLLAAFALPRPGTESSRIHMLTFSTWASHLCPFLYVCRIPTIALAITWKSFCRNIGYSPRNLPLALKPAGMLNQTTWDSLADRIRFGYSSVIELLGGKTRERGISGDTMGYRGIQEIPRGNSWFHSHRQSSPVIASHGLILLELVARSIQIGELRHAKPLRCEAKHPKMVPRWSQDDPRPVALQGLGRNGTTPSCQSRWQRCQKGSRAISGPSDLQLPQLRCRCGMMWDDVEWCRTRLDVGPKNVNLK